MSQVSLPLDVSTAMQDASRVFGRYVLLQQLGRGGMGTVYKAWQIPLKRYVAIKILHEGESEDNLARFMREAQTASQLHHSNIAAIYEVGNHAGRFFIAMQFIDGVTMDALFERKLEREKLLKILRAASLAVHAAHEKGVVHRDLKPSNIMLSREGRPFVLDFGIARQLRGGDTLTEAGMVVGTPTYMAPEQASGNPQTVDRRSDVWSLGVILYEILTGTVPHRGRSPAETLMYLVNQDPPAPSTRTPDVPRELEAVCMKALERERRRRYATAEQFAEDIQRWLDGTAVSAKPLTVMEKLQRRLVRLRRQIVAAIALTVLAGAGVVGWSVVQRTRREKTRLEAREAMGREKWTDALRLWERLGDDAEAKVKAAECQRRLDEMQRTASLRTGQEEMDKANDAWRKAMDVLTVPGQHETLRQLLRTAESHAQAAVKIHAAEASWWFRLGEIRYELRDAGALAALSNALERDRNLAQAYYLRAKLNASRLFDAHVYQTTPSRALFTLISDIRHDLDAAVKCGIPGDRQPLVEAMRFLCNDEEDEAEKVLRSLSAGAAEDLDVLELVTRVYFRTRKWPELEDCLARLCRQRPNNARYVLRRAQAATFQGNHRDGMEQLERALRMDPDDITLRHNTARLLLTTGNYAVALREFDEVLRREPLNHAALCGKAECLSKTGKKPEARELFARVAEEGREALAEELLIMAMRRGGNAIGAIDESVAMLRQLEVRGTPASRHIRRRVHAERALAYRDLSQWEPCLREMEAAIQLDSRTARDYLVAAEALIELKRNRVAAERYFEQGRSLCFTQEEIESAKYVSELLTKSRNP